MVKERLAGVMLDQPLRGIQDYVDVILNRKPMQLYLPSPLPLWTRDISPDLPALWLDEQGEATDIHVMNTLTSGHSMPEKL